MNRAHFIWPIGFTIMLFQGPANSLDAQDEFPNFRLRPGTEVRVEDATGGTIRGTFVGFSRGALEISTREGTTFLTRQAIDSLWAMEASTAKGTVIGGVLGVVVGVVGGFFVDAVACPNRGCPNSIPVLAVAVGGAGAYVGAQRGSTILSWHLKIP
ncbi:MAG: hypothetical protein OEZ54_03165 [Gemmatimonadota bacterium]|nr:hypothetical protein [Gemmatimonadota bacterium]